MVKQAPPEQCPKEEEGLAPLQNLTEASMLRPQENLVKLEESVPDDKAMKSVKTPCTVAVSEEVKARIHERVAQLQLNMQLREARLKELFSHVEKLQQLFNRDSTPFPSEL